MKNLVLYCLFNLIAVHLLHANQAHTPFQSKAKAAFEENKGQVLNPDQSINTEVKFVIRQVGMTVFIKNNGIIYQFEKITYPKDYQINNLLLGKNLNKLDSKDSSVRIETHRIDMSLVNSQKKCRITATGKSKDYTNYYTHNALEVYSVNKIIIHDVYPNIDWIIYLKNDKLKYEFRVRKNGNPSNILMNYSGQTALEINSEENLIIHSKLGDIQEFKPISYQKNGRINSKFKILDKTIRFDIPSFNRLSELIIDPVVQWATYHAANQGASQITHDESKNVYLLCLTTSISGLAYNGYQSSYGGGAYDVLLIKFDSIGNRIWATYYGGGAQDIAFCMKMDKANYLYIAGSTLSSGIAYNGYQNSMYIPSNGFIVKFNLNGQRIWATYYGKKGGRINSLSLDDSCNIYVVGGTQSDSFMSSNGYQNTYAGSLDGFIAKFDSTGRNRIWASYFGGSGGDELFTSDFENGNLYVAGITTSSSGVASGGYKNSHNGTAEGVFAKFTRNGAFVWGSYYGGASTDKINVLRVMNNKIYTLGPTSSTSGLNMNVHQVNIGGSEDCFLAKFDTNCNLIWNTYYGGSGSDLPFANIDAGLSIDQKENIYITGRTNSSNNMAYRGLKNSYSGSDDVFLAKFNKNGTRIWGSYYGGNNQDLGADVHSTRDGMTYFCGYTKSPAGIATNGSFQSSCSNCITNGNSFLVKLSCNRDTTLYDTICRGDTLVFNGIARTQSGIYLDTLETWDICDSFITMNLTVARRDTVHRYDTICQGTSKAWNGNQVSSAGVYLDTLMNNEFCDSFLIYHLYIRPLDSTRIYDTSCGNTPRTWNGINLTTAGVYRDTLQNRYGCDSFLFYYYIPKTASSSSPIISICKGSSYTVGSKTYASSGTYRDTLKNYQGCDSLVTLTLTVRDTSYTSWTASICQGNYYLFQGDTLRSAGVYRDTLKNKNGCDSTVQVTLSVNNLGSKTIYDTICPDKSYTFASKVFTASGIYRDSLKTKKGCDSIVTLNLFVRPKKPLTIVDSNDRLTATAGFNTYKWYRNSLPLSTPNLNYYFPSQSGSFKVEVTEKNGCKYFSDSIPIVKLGINTQSSSLNIEVFPNPAKDHLYIRWNLPQEIQITIYTTDGRRLALPMQRISNLLYSISTTSLSAGVYAIELKTPQETETRSFVVE